MEHGVGRHVFTTKIWNQDESLTLSKTERRETIFSSLSALSPPLMEFKNFNWKCRTQMMRYERSTMKLLSYKLNKPSSKAFVL